MKPPVEEFTPMIHRRGLMAGAVAGLGGLALAACGGGGQGASTPPPAQPPADPGPELVTTPAPPQDAPAPASLGVIASEFRRIKASVEGALEQLQALALRLRSEGLLQNVEIDEAGLMVSGTLNDGRIALIANNREVKPRQGSAVSSATNLAATGISRAKALVNELPSAEHARVLHAFGPNFEGQDVVEDLQGWLQAAGYKVRAGEEGDARLTTLRRLRGDGFLYLNCHGGTCRIRVGGLGSAPTQNTLYALQSSTPCSDAMDATPEIKDDFANRRLVYFLGEDWRYAVTHAFVEEYWRFANDSVVILNACHSADSKAENGASSFLFALHKKGASVVMGWTESVSATAAYTTPRYFVDRLLGANKYRPESPEQRAFAWDSVMQDMEKKGLLVDPAPAHRALPPARFVARPSPASARTHVLAPSLRHVSVNEYLGELELTGLFGAQQARPTRVEVDGSALQIVKWESDRIVCKLPSTGAGSAGPVVVRVGDFRSNIRLLTEWSVELDFAWKHPAAPQATAKVAGPISLRFRADLEPWRESPGQEPQVRATHAVATKDSLARLTASGFFQPPGAPCAETWKGAGEFRSISSGPLGQNALFAYLKLTHGQPTADLSLQLISQKPPFTRDLCGPEYGFMVSTGQPDRTAEFRVPADQRFDAFTHVEMPSWAIPLEGYVLAGVNRKALLEQPTITWARSTVRFPPLYSRPPTY